jgi:GT2 family glycosyltransferase
MTTAAVVLLTRGDRPETLAAAIASIHAQRDAAPSIVVVGNGADPGPVAPGVEVVRIPENVGVARGRNAGWKAATADVVFFLDDDARYASPTLVADTMRRFATLPRLAVVSFRIADDAGRVMRQHVPMLRKGRPERVLPVTTFLGGACAIRRSALAETGGFAEEFVYALEETDLAWRLIDSRWDVVYAGDQEVIHPRVGVAQREGATFHTARSRVLLVRRRLPLVLGLIHLPIRFVLSLTNLRSREDLRSLWRGYRDGFRTPVRERRPMRWSTVWKMTRLGRPPVV